MDGAVPFNESFMECSHIPLRDNGNSSLMDIPAERVRDAR